MKDEKSDFPKWTVNLLRKFCPERLLEEIEGDLQQKFHRDLNKFGRKKAKRRLLWNVIRFFRPGILLRNRISVKLNHNLMFGNYIKVAIRNALRKKAFSVINVIGLAIGITSAALIMLWVQNELSYDRFHRHSDRLYEAWNKDTFDGKIQSWSHTPRILAPTLKEEYPQVENAVSYADWEMEFLFRKGDIKFTSNTGCITGSGFLSLFNFPLIAGDLKTALNDPSSIVLTEKFAKKLFGDQKAFGESIQMTIDNIELEFQVTGILKDLPNNTTFDFDYLISWELLKSFGEEDTYWGNNSVFTFVKLLPNTSLEEFNAKVKDVEKIHSSGEFKNEIFLYPVTKLRLYSRFVNGFPDGGRIEIVRLFEITAFFLILISCINFMNLSTANSEQRAREVGIRKTIGAHKRSLIGLFLTESIIIAIVAGLISMICIQIFLPLFNNLTEKQLIVNYYDPVYWFGTIGLMFFVGIVAGSYPAFYLSSFRPMQVIKGNYISASSGKIVRRILVVFQFCFAIVLVFAALVVQEQINSVQKRETGYSRDNLIYHSISGDIEKNYIAYRDELINSRIAVSMSKTAWPITEQWSNTTGIEWQGKDPNSKIVFNRYSVDEDFVTTAGLQIIVGRDLDLSKYPSDSSAALINESAATIMGFANPIGEHFKDNSKEWRIAGVFKDFVSRSPYNRIAPMVVDGSKLGMLNFIHIRLSNDVPLDEALNNVGRIFKKYNPEYPFEYHFVDVEYGKKFNEEIKIRKIASVFGTMAVIISSLGIFGLSIYVAQKRIKEIGIRKVFGASVLNVITLLSKEPVKLILIAFIIAAPIGYWAMDLWLQNYEYKVAISWIVFAVTGFGSLIVAMTTISFQTIISALNNPVNSLRHE